MFCSGPSGCCDWPSCYDERVQLCLDTCLNTWTQCPAKLFLMTCYSPYMSPFGELPLQCFPDAAPHIQVLKTVDVALEWKKCTILGLLVFIHRINGISGRDLPSKCGRFLSYRVILNFLLNLVSCSFTDNFWYSVFLNIFWAG